MMLGSPQVIISIKLVTSNFEYALLSANRTKSTAASYTIYSQKMIVTLLGDKSPRELRVHQQTHMPSGKNKFNETSKSVSITY